MEQPILDDVMQVMRAKGYPIHEPEDQQICLNIVGIRSNDRVSNSYDDWIFAFYKDPVGMWINAPARATCDPGLPYRLKPMHPRGTAILKPGHYPGSHVRGLHRGTEALVQEGYTPVTIYMDNNRNNVLDTEGMEEATGWFGINIHGPYSVDGVDYTSAGCQAYKDISKLDLMLRLADVSKARTRDDLPGVPSDRKFYDYTLITEADLG